MNIKKRAGILVIILILITITLIFLIPSISNKYTYTNPNGERFTFYKSRVGDTLMHTLSAYANYKDNKENYEYAIALRNSPKSLEDIQVQQGIKNKILNKKYIYITLDPEFKGEAVLASIEIAKVLGQANYGIFKIPTQGALLYSLNKTNSTNTPVITCNNANKEIGVIWLNLGKENKIYSSRECVIVEAVDYKNLIKVADRLVYDLLDVM